MKLFKEMTSNLKRALLKRQLYSQINDVIEKKDNKSLLNFLEKGYIPDEKQLTRIMRWREPVMHQETMDKMYEIYQDKDEKKFLDSFSVMLQLYKTYKKQKRKDLYGKSEIDKWRKKEQKFLDLMVKESTADTCNFMIAYSAYKIFFKESEATLVAHKGLISIMDAIMDFRYVLHRENYAPLEEVLDNYKKLYQILLEQAPRIKIYEKEVNENLSDEKKQDNTGKYDSLLKPQPVKKIVHELSQLPEESYELIENINKNYQSIPLESLLVDRRLELENIYKVRLHQLLEQYKKLPPEYKSKHRQEESPDKLLLESLMKIDRNIAEILESCHLDNHNKLKVTHRYFSNT